MLSILRLVSKLNLRHDSHDAFITSNVSNVSDVSYVSNISNVSQCFQVSQSFQFNACKVPKVSNNCHVFNGAIVSDVSKAVYEPAMLAAS